MAGGAESPAVGAWLGGSTAPGPGDAGDCGDGPSARPGPDSGGPLGVPGGAGGGPSPPPPKPRLSPPPGVPVVDPGGLGGPAGPSRPRWLEGASIPPGAVGPIRDSGIAGVRTSGASGSPAPTFSSSGMPSAPRVPGPEPSPRNPGTRPLSSRPLVALRPLATEPVFDSAPPGTNSDPMLNAAAPAARPGWSLDHLSQATNSLPMSARTPGSFDGSLATVIKVWAMPFQVSGSAIATVPATVLINPVVRPTWKSVYSVNPSARAPPTSSPSSSSKCGRTQFCNDVTASPSASASSPNRPTIPLTCRWKFSSTVPTSRATSRRMSSASPVKIPFTMSHAPSNEIRSSSRRMASWVSCTPPANSSMAWASPEAEVDIFDTASLNLPRTSSIFPPSGICCAATTAFTGATASSKTERP